MSSRFACSFFFVLLVTIGLAHAEEAVTRVAELQLLAERFEEELERARPALYDELLASTRAPNRALNEDPEIQLMFVGENGQPFYYATENDMASQTVNTFRVWPGGGYGFALTGATTLLGQLGIWDGGAVRTSHQELTGRAVQMDGAGGLSNHATHVSGTMIGSGVDPSAKGMSYAGTLACRDWNSDQSEMAAAAAGGLRISNHSYGFATGWRFDGSNWYWFGDIGVSSVEDYGFGFYDETSRDWDEIARNAPYYLICVSAGNDRNDFGPGPGGQHFVWDDGWVTSFDTREPDGGSDGYDCINWHKTAKNIMTVGAIEDIPGGFSRPSDVVMSTFSNWGPTDDGRIKPDLVANGVGLYSSTAGGNSVYSTYSGTSMAAPNLSGSANLIGGYYELTHGTAPTAATLKAILIHTASEAGPAKGPEYSYGWGLLNTLAAAELVQADSTQPGHVTEEVLANGEIHEYHFTSSAVEPVSLTLVWTDPPGTPPLASLNPTDPMLVNDLDLRLEEATVGWLYEPWILDPANPSAAASRGDNVRDNVEQVEVTSIPASDYIVRVSHKGTLEGGLDQSYSLVSSRPLSSSPPATAAENLTPLGPTNRKASAHPNPFEESTTIEFEIAQTTRVSIEVYDVQGRAVRTLEGGVVRESGLQRVTWDGRDSSGARVPAGVYLIRVEAGPDRFTKKAVLVATD